MGTAFADRLNAHTESVSILPFSSTMWTIKDSSKLFEIYLPAGSDPDTVDYLYVATLKFCRLDSLPDANLREPAIFIPQVRYCMGFFDHPLIHHVLVFSTMDWKFITGAGEEVRRPGSARFARFVQRLAISSRPNVKVFSGSVTSALAFDIQPQAEVGAHSQDVSVKSYTVWRSLLHLANSY
jgi:hypothetical protein